MPVSPFDIARSHVRLPIGRNYGALKTALRDWRRYTEQTPLGSKVAFPAALCIEVRRPSPAALLSTASSASGAAAVFRGASGGGGGMFASRLSAWKQRHGLSGKDTTTTSSHGTEGREGLLPHVHRTLVPLSLYTALLPWEVQRGLSLTELTLPTTTADNVADADAVQASASASSSAVGNDNDDADPYGVVTTAEVAKDTATASAETIPGMLFLLDLQSVQANGGQIGFWSGAITRPIDVCFFSPTQSASVAGPGNSFSRMRDRDVAMQVEDNEIAPAVVAKFFPKNELRSPRYALRLHTYGHLDPFPWCEAVEGNNDDGDGDDEERCFSVEATHTRENEEDAATLPRFVLETVRHAVSAGVTRAMQESLADYARVYGDEGLAILKTATATVSNNRKGAAGPQQQRQQNDDEAVELDITLDLSAALRDDLVNKAQLHAHYVSMIEEAVAGYAGALSRPVVSDAADAPLGQDDDIDNNGIHTSDGGDDGSSDPSQRRMQVWLSETEQVWVTPAKLAAMQREQTRKHDQTPCEAKLADEEAEAAAAMSDAAGADANGGERDDDDDDDAYLAETETEQEQQQEEDDSHLVATTSRGATDRKNIGNAASAAFATAAREGGTSAARSIGRQSPMLADEDEGRPSYLAPSFTGRHEAATLNSNSNSSSSSSSSSVAHLVSADKMARYVKTSSDAPILPPIDYELLDLCMRLGVGTTAILYHYYERILREWRAELLGMRAAAKQQQKQGTTTTQSAEAPVQSSPSSRIADSDIARMSAMVHDPSLQVPEEMRSLVDAVAKARGIIAAPTVVVVG